MSRKEPEAHAFFIDLACESCAQIIAHLNRQAKSAAAKEEASLQVKLILTPDINPAGVATHWHLSEA